MALGELELDRRQAHGIDYSLGDTDPLGARRPERKGSLVPAMAKRASAYQALPNRAAGAERLSMQLKKEPLTLLFYHYIGLILGGNDSYTPL